MIASRGRLRKRRTLRGTLYGALKRLGAQGLPLVPTALNRKLEQFGRLGYVPDYERPRTFHERLVWLLEHVEDERRTHLADKLAAKDFALARYPSLKVAPVLTAAATGAGLQLDGLPERCVLKTNNNSGTVWVLQQPIDRRAVVAQADAWLALDPCAGKPTWERHYAGIEPRAFIEAFLGDDPSVRLTDYRVFVFAGRAHFVWLRTHRPDGTRVRLLVDRDWRLLPVGRPSSPGAAARPPDPALVPPRPAGLPDLLAAAEALAGDLPFVRADFYLVGGDLYFGELTFAPSAGYIKFPLWFDRELGRHLPLPIDADGVQERSAGRR